jgi:three-Cys-motif partner protein
MPRRIPTNVWLQEKFQRLNEMTKVILQDHEGQYGEPEYGFWSLKKEIALMYWIWPFLTIASFHFESFYYLDLFAGSGLMKANDHFMVGSPLVAVASTLPDKQFSEYICLEIDRTRAEVLKKRAQTASKAFDTPLPKVFNVDCNKELPRILKRTCKGNKTCFLAFLDPENIKDLRWKTIQNILTIGKGDIIVTFPTQGIIRNLELAKDNPKLGELFLTFFGDEEWRNITAEADAIIDYYKSKFSQADGFIRAVDNVVVRDDLNHRLYDLIFATGSRGMHNAMQDLKTRLRKIKTKDIRNIHQVIAESQSQLTDFPGYPK